MLLAFSSVFCAMAQDNVADMTGKTLINSPNAAFFTKYGKVPVSLFNGIPDIKIPLYEVKVDNFSMPIYLSYYAKGIQPNSHAGWVGTGWNLFAGSVITRKINGAPDEWVIPYNFSNYTAGTGIGWYYQHSALNNPNWSSVAALSNYSGGIAIGTTGVSDAAPDEFDFDLNGITGAFFLGEDGAWKVRANTEETIKVQVIAPGAYPFASNPNIRNNQSTFVGNTFTQFILTTGDGTKYYFGGDPYSIEFNRAGLWYTPYNTNTIAMSWHLKQIILSSGKIIDFEYFRDGNQYVYNPSTRGGYYQFTSGPVMPTWFSAFNNNSVSTSLAQLVANDVNVNITDPVYLQSISYPEGKLIFNSSHSGEVDILDPPFNYFCDQGSSCGNSYPGAYSFFALLSNYSYQIDPQGQPSQPLPPSTWYKLNDIELDDYIGNKLKDIKFSYIPDNSIAARLLLNSVQTFGYFNGNNASLPPYTFVYNSTPLPGYSSQQVDHWGFYDGPAAINPFPSIPLDATYWPTIAGQTSYYNFREPNASYIQAEILTQINYPAGGSTQFLYEPNQYLKWVGSFPSPITTLSQPATGGGLRIKKIISQANLSSLPVTYEYSYINNLTSNTSSGVLGMPRPTYFENDTVRANTGVMGIFAPVATYANLLYKYWSSTSVFPSENDDGNIVTYTNVIERQSSNGIYNGMKLTNFSNHDNGYLNYPPDAEFFTGLNHIQLYHYNDRSFERGRVLSEVYFDGANDTLKKLAYSYNSDTTKYVKCILSDSRVVDLQIVLPSAPPNTDETDLAVDPEYSDFSTTTNLNFFRTSAIRMYTFYPYLKQTIETDYPTDHTANPIVTTSNYSYDLVNGTRNLVKKTINDSKGELVITNSRYPLDFSSTTFTDPFSLGIQNMQNIYAIGTPVEKYIQKSNSDGTNLRTISSLLNAYDPLLPVPDLVYQSEIITPLTSFTPATIASGNLSKDPSYQPKFYIDRYDNIGNILQQHKINDVNQAYQWGYNNEHPTAKLINAINNYQNYNSYTATTQGLTYTFVPNNLTLQLQTFTTFNTGTITISIGFSGNPGSNTTANVSYNLVGPSNEMGQLCTNGCTTQNSISFTNMPVGGYILTITPNINNSAANLVVTCTYPGFTTVPHISGSKEFYYESFEENALGVPVPAGLMTGFAGNKVFYNGQFKVPFKRPDTRAYTISYFLNGQSHTSSYTVDSMTINASGMALDEVRVYPSDAQITTYTYAPLIGMTAMNDPNNKVTYYEYEALGRLKNVKDFQGNIIKNFQYNYVTSCGNNCYVLPMQTINGSNTIGYPVGVFNVAGQLVGNATTQALYVSLWNGNSANHTIGTLVAGTDPMHFNLTVNTGMTTPPAVTGCRYYQVDIAWNYMDAVRNLNGCYVDFGDGTGMRLGKTSTDTAGLILAPSSFIGFTSGVPYFIHIYPDTTLKTVTLYHNDASESPDFDSWLSYTNLSRLKNFRGNYPQNMQLLGGTSYQQASANSVSGITNWGSINSINTWYPYGGYSGVYADPCRNMNYSQDFMANNIGLTTIHSANGSFYTQGYADTTFKISRLKSNWNSYFTNLTAIAICDDQWNRENLSSLPQLIYFNIICANQNHSNVQTNNPLVLIPTSVIDNIFIQISAGSGQTLSNGTIIIQSGGTTFTSASSAARTQLKSKGWSLYIDSVLQ
jgi:hypothetical protein